jgi:hypothetical protein
MGIKAEEALEISLDELPTYMRTKHSVYMDLDGKTYYLTDVNEHYWRAQDAALLNEKNHFTDASELVPTVNEFLALPFIDDKSIEDVFDQATFYASEKPAS